MASNRAVVTALATLSEAFPTREVTERTADVWMTILADVSDEALGRAALRLCRDPERRFFPSSGEVFAAIGSEAKPVNVVDVLHRIERLGQYNPNLGWVYPTGERIREVLGDAIADAYSVAGHTLVFADSDITRDIARRAMSERLNDLQRRQPGVPVLPALPAPRVATLEPEIPRERPPLFLSSGDLSPLSPIIARIVAGVEIGADDDPVVPA